MKYTSFAKALRDAVDNPGEPTVIVEHPLDHSVTPAKFVRYTADVALAVDEDIPAAARRAIVEAIRRERLWATGEAIHEADMVAVVGGVAYDDSCRGWGALLAEAWCDPADRMAYVCFAWGVRPDPVVPPGARTVDEVLDGKPADELHRPRMTDDQARQAIKDLQDRAEEFRSQWKRAAQAAGWKTIEVPLVWGRIWDHTRTVVLGADGVRLAGETPWGWAPVHTSSREAPDPMDLGRIHYMEGRWS